jgi:hypothetical protein
MAIANAIAYLPPVLKMKTPNKLEHLTNIFSSNKYLLVRSKPTLEWRTQTLKYQIRMKKLGSNKCPSLFSDSDTVKEVK